MYSTQMVKYFEPVKGVGNSPLCITFDILLRAPTHYSVTVTVTDS
jgi:hypothetical protein